MVGIDVVAMVRVFPSLRLKLHPAVIIWRGTTYTHSRLTYGASTQLPIIWNNLSALLCLVTTRAAVLI